MEYKGIFYNESEEFHYYEGGAHFPYKDLVKRLEKLKSEREEKNNFESNFSDKKIDNNNHINKEILSRNKNKKQNILNKVLENQIKNFNTDLKKNNNKILSILNLTINKKNSKKVIHNKISQTQNKKNNFTRLNNLSKNKLILQNSKIKSNTLNIMSKLKIKNVSKNKENLSKEKKIIKESLNNLLCLNNNNKNNNNNNNANNNNNNNNKSRNLNLNLKNKFSKTFFQKKKVENSKEKKLFNIKISEFSTKPNSKQNFLRNNIISKNNINISSRNSKNKNENHILNLNYIINKTNFQKAIIMNKNKIIYNKSYKK